MEPLEDRLLLSTTIAYTPTSINIVGDTARTGQINVSGTAGNPYAVTVAGETPVVKGTPPLVSSGVSITVSTGNAGRTVNVTPANARNITVNGGTGNDTITVGSVASNVFSGNIAINGGSGTNNLAVSFVDIAGNVTIKGGTGADTVNVGAGGSISGSTTINTGDGANGVTLDSVTIRGKWTINGGKDVDTVTLGTGGTTRLLGNGSINTKAGNDRIFFNKGTYGSRPPITTTTVSAGDGDDDIRALEPVELGERAMQSGDADVMRAFDAVAHDFGGDGGFLGHRQIARAGADHGDEAGALRQRFFLDGHATGGGMMDGELEFFLQRAGVLGGDAGDEHRLAVLQKFRRDFDNLLRRLARTEDHFGEILAERAVRVHLREAEVGHRRGLKRVQHLLHRNFSGAKLLQQLRGFGRCHRGTMPHESPAVTRENRGSPLPSPL